MPPTALAVVCGTAALLVAAAGCGADADGLGSSPEPFSEAEGLREYREIFPEHQVSDRQITEAGRWVCTTLREGGTTDDIVAGADEFALEPLTDDHLRSVWVIVFFGVRVYCPEFTDDLPRQQPW
jgi:hypothetical protein